MTDSLDEVEPRAGATVEPEPLSLDQTDLVYALVLLRDKLSDVVVRATTTGPRACPWAELAVVLDGAATLCRRQAILAPECASD